MALIVEDGSIVAGANTYVTVAELDDFASARGTTLPAIESDKEILIIKAMDYVEAYRARFQGSKVEAAQPVQWPRINVEIDGFSFPSDEIPIDLKNAQLQAGLEVNSLDDLSPTQTESIKKEKVDVLETEYFSPQEGAISSPNYPKVDAYLDALLKNGGSSQIFMSPIR